MRAFRAAYPGMYCPRPRLPLCSLMTSMVLSVATNSGGLGLGADFQDYLSEVSSWSPQSKRFSADLDPDDSPRIEWDKVWQSCGAQVAEAQNPMFEVSVLPPVPISASSDTLFCPVSFVSCSIKAKREGAKALRFLETLPLRVLSCELLISGR